MCPEDFILDIPFDRKPIAGAAFIGILASQMLMGHGVTALAN
jgi:hypothetical protein